MNIIFLGTRGFPGVQGGVENHCENLAVNLARLGCRVTVFTRRPYINRALKEYKGVRLIDLPALRQKTLEALLHTFLGVIKCIGYKPDILHIHGVGPGVFAPLAKLLGFKVVLTSHGSNYRHQKWNRFEKAFLKICEYLSIKFSDVIIAVSGIIQKEIKEKYGREAYYIPNGIQPLEHGGSLDKLDEYCLKAGKYILAVGRLVPEKGFHDLVDAFSMADAPGWKLVIAGGMDHASRYGIDLVKKAEKDNRIVFTGFLTGKPLFELYDNAGFFVLPSYYEGMPISLLEAMSFGLYSIASDIPANRSIGLPEENYFKKGDIGSLSRIITGLAGKQEGLRIERQQVDDLLKAYDWGVISEKTLKVYEKLA